MSNWTVTGDTTVAVFVDDAEVVRDYAAGDAIGSPDTLQDAAVFRVLSDQGLLEPAKPKTKPATGK